ncbi:hypothetical protein E2C01_026732 [Portunus trituberculatus]|uniref:Endonuclease/exonuclease/phosphatase domain-containing protein n=1 Tax=Portunus trituberculatus TaxID=210409 RepID=A0A5B7EK03_PORTR|nr:hypothetical protein [Portunus trituberculatus]
MENFSIGEMDHKCFYPSGLVDPFNLKVDAQKQGSQTHAEKANVLVGIGDKRTEYKEVTCSIGEITAGEEIIVSLRSRLVLRTLKELELGTAVKNASSFMDLQITKMPLSHDLPPPSSSTIDTKISYQNENPDATTSILGDFNVHHQPWLSSPFTDHPGKLAFNFAILHDLEQLVIPKVEVPLAFCFSQLGAPEEVS